KAPTNIKTTKPILANGCSFMVAPCCVGTTDGSASHRVAAIDLCGACFHGRCVGTPRDGRDKPVITCAKMSRVLRRPLGESGHSPHRSSCGSAGLALFSGS